MLPGRHHHRTRASIQSQVVPQPFILSSSQRSSLASTHSQDDMSRQGSQHSSKRDSAISTHGLFPRVPSLKTNVPPISHPSSTTSPSTPVYKLGRSRLVPSEAGTPSHENPSPRPPAMDRLPAGLKHTYSREDISRVTSRDNSRQDPRWRGSTDRHPSARPPTSRRPSTHSHRTSDPDNTEEVLDRGFGPSDRSSKESVYSEETAATSIHTLPALQQKGPENGDAQHLEPIGEDDPRSWDLVDPPGENGSQPTGVYALERRAEQLLSPEHLQTIFDDPKLLLKFTSFLNHHRSKSIAVLIYYLDALKALRAIGYANAIAEALDPIAGQDFTKQVARPTKNQELEEKAGQAFDILVREDLPAYVAHEWVRLVSVSVQRRITGTLAPHLREASEGLAEVFCLSDPSRADNPIVFASEEFARTTQYGMGYTIGRNCRFLQGPRTSPHSVRRLKEACVAGKEHTELLVNYRRDGSPFMNLLMIAPLMDSKGAIRYYIGAQVDVSGLIRDCSNMDGLVQLLEKEADSSRGDGERHKKDEFQQLTEMFNGAELDTVNRFGGMMHKEYANDPEQDGKHHTRRRVLLKDESQDADDKVREQISGSVPTAKLERINGKLQGVYENYILIRPAPSLRILFTSPSLRVPGILQSPFLNRIGGSSRVRADLSAALAEGRGVTAKIRWLTRADENGDGEGRPRWIHCTPLIGHSGSVGVWMIVLVDEESSSPSNRGGGGRRFRDAPPVSSNINGKEWHPDYNRDKSRPDTNRLNAYDVDEARRGGGSNKEDYPYHGISRDDTYVAQQSAGGRREPSVWSQPRSAADASEFSFGLQ